MRQGAGKETQPLARQRVLVMFCRINRYQAGSRGAPNRIRPARPKYVFQHAHPSAQFTKPWYRCLHRLHEYHRTLLPAMSPKLFSRLRDQNLRLLRQARHVHEAFSRTRTPRTRPSFVRRCKARADVARLPLRVLGARLRRDRHSLGVIFICVALLGAACFFNSLQSLSWPPSFQCCTWHSGPCACAAAAAFLPNDKPSGGRRRRTA